MCVGVVMTVEGRRQENVASRLQSSLLDNFLADAECVE
jgi:hypothetical protein